MKMVSDHKTKADTVYESLRDAIISGELAPGNRVIIRDVAAQLGVSEIPVREALKRLESEGLIVSTPYIGALVSIPSLRELQEIMEIRGSLESLAAVSSAKNMADDDIAELVQLLGEMEKCAAEQRFWDYSKVDREFHRVLCGRCDNEKLMKMLEDLWRQSERARAIFNVMTVSTKASLEEHKEMLEALRSKDYERLERVVREQRVRVRASLQNFADRNGSVV
ncbi:MAG: GntR family transcriptional regulator [Firmicutes bacterium]|nr:GntR family transcriptional regulator [Bacillota bacterium]